MLDTVEFEARIQEILDAHRGMEGSLLPILHAVQEAFGHVPEEALPIIAASLDISKAEAHGVMTFYHDFRAKPAGRTVLKICRAEACQAAFGTSVADKAKEKLGIDWHETTADGAVTLEPVFCLGLCACAPAAMVGDKLVGMLTPKKVAALIDEVRK
jgi:formate dehydrogenase subunit gamma